MTVFEAKTFRNAEPRRSPQALFRTPSKDFCGTTQKVHRSHEWKAGKSTFFFFPLLWVGRRESYIVRKHSEASVRSKTSSSLDGCTLMASLCAVQVVCDSYRQASTRGYLRDSQYTTVYKQQQMRRVTKSFLLFSGAKQAWTHVQSVRLRYSKAWCHRCLRVCSTFGATSPKSNSESSTKTDTGESSGLAVSSLGAVSSFRITFRPICHPNLPLQNMRGLWELGVRKYLSTCLNRYRCSPENGEVVLETPKALHCCLKWKRKINPAVALTVWKSSGPMLETRMPYKCSNWEQY